MSDSSSSAVSGLSLRDGGNQGQPVNPNLNLSTSSTSCDAHDPKTREILRLRAENADLKRRLRDIEDSDAVLSIKMLSNNKYYFCKQGIVYICKGALYVKKCTTRNKVPQQPP